MKTNRLKQLFYSTALSAFAMFALSGCMEEREIPTDDLVTLYNSDMEKTSKMNPLDTMYAQVGGLGENKRYEIRVLDSDKNYITSTQVMTDENGTVAPTAIWYDIGVAKPDASNNSFHIKKYDTLQLKSFYINVVDIDTNGANTNFYQPFYYVSSTNAVTADAPKPVIYACNSNGVIENAFEETGSKDMNGNDSILTKVYLKVDTLPTKDYTGHNDPLNSVDVYVVPFNSGFADDVNISELNATVALHDVNVSELKSYTGVLIWDLNDVNTSKHLVNPNEKNSAYSIIIDLNKDGKYTVGTDLNGDKLTDRYVDAVDGGLVPGFIVQNTPANELTYSLTNSAGEKISSVPECIGGKGGSVYLNIDNLMTSKTTLPVSVGGASVNVDILEPQYGTDGRYLKYVERAKIFDSCTAPTNVADGAIADIAVNVDKDDFDGSSDINETIKVYSVLTSITTTNGETNTTVFDESGTTNGDTKIYLLSDTAYTANLYLFDGNVTDFSDTTKALASKTNVSLLANSSVLAFDLNEDLNITNPKENNGMYRIFVDGTNDKNLTISIRDTAKGNLPDVGYINIASKGINYYEFDNHNNDEANLSVYGYIDEFYADGSNTEYSYDDYYWGQGLKVIWNPYIKNRSKGGYFGNYWGSYGSTSTYTDFSGDTQQSPFSFGQRVAIYIIDADTYKLQAGMTLDGKDVRGYATIVTVQYSCSNGAGQQVVWKPNMRVGKYYMILDMDMDGKLTEGVDFVDAVDSTGKTIKEDSSVVGFSVVE